MSEDAQAQTRQLQGMREMAWLQAHVCYMNVDRTLATWTRTALTLIVFGTVLDRYGLLLAAARPPHAGTLLAQNPLSTLSGIVLVAIGVFMVTSAAIRHQLYRAHWHRTWRANPGFGPWLAFPFSVLVALVGMSILFVLLFFLF